jgi:hypothetical protein
VKIFRARVLTKRVRIKLRNLEKASVPLRTWSADKAAKIFDRLREEQVDFRGREIEIVKLWRVCLFLGFGDL